MNLRPAFANIVDAIALPRLVLLAPNLWGAAFTLMKILPARFILDRAQDEGQIGTNTVIIESTSGTFGLALAMECALRGLKLILVSDPAIDPALRRRLEELGAHVEIVQTPSPKGGFQRTRLDRLADFQAMYPDHFWPQQYSTKGNPTAYAIAAELIAESIGQIDCLVGPVGSGGSMCRTSGFLRLSFPHLHVGGVDTHGSIVFGQPDGKRLLRGLGNSLMPPNVDHTVFDSVHWVGAAEAFRATRALHQEHALFMGPTSGAAYLVARWWAKKNPDATTVVFFPDEGYRYQDTVYKNAWLHQSGVWLPKLPTEPSFVDHPLESGSDWTWMDWNRRSYEEAVGKPFSVE